MFPKTSGERRDKERRNWPKPVHLASERKRPVQDLATCPSLTSGARHGIPLRAVAWLVLLQPIRFNLENEANTLHAATPKLVKAPQQEAVLFAQSPFTAKRPPTARHQRESHVRSSWRSDRRPARGLRWHNPAGESAAG